MDTRELIISIQKHEKYSDQQMADLIDKSLRTFYRYKSGETEPPEEVTVTLKRIYERKILHRAKPYTLKAMAFVDADWLMRALSDVLFPQSDDFRSKDNYSLILSTKLEALCRRAFLNLPRVLEGELRKNLYLPEYEIELVRVYAVGAIEKNETLSERERRQADFILSLKELPCYETPVAGDHVQARMLLALHMLGYGSADLASLDVMVVVTGSNFFIPGMEMVRRSGIRLALASIKGSCSYRLIDEEYSDKIMDFPVIWLENLIQDLTSIGTLEDSESSENTAIEGTIAHIDRGKRWGFIADETGRTFFFSSSNVCQGSDFELLEEGQLCRFQIANLPGSAMNRMKAVQVRPLITLPPKACRGYIVLLNRGLFREDRYGLVESADGQKFHFHEFDLPAEVDFESLTENQPVWFEILRMPTKDKPGAVKTLYLNKE